MAGATTFLTMLYIVIVNPTMFAAGGMDFGGVPWQEALGAAAVSSGLFIVLSVTKFRELFINSIPESLKLSMGAVFLGMVFAALAALILGHWELLTEIFSTTHGLDET